MTGPQSQNTAPQPPTPAEEAARIQGEIDALDQRSSEIPRDITYAEHQRDTAQAEADQVVDAQFTAAVERTRGAVGSLTVAASLAHHRRVPGIPATPNTEHNNLQPFGLIPGMKVRAYAEGRNDAQNGLPNQSHDVPKDAVNESHFVENTVRAYGTRRAHQIRNKTGLEHPLVQITGNRSVEYAHHEPATTKMGKLGQVFRRKHAVNAPAHKARVGQLNRDEALAVAAGHVEANARYANTADVAAFKHDQSTEVVELGPLKERAINEHRSATGSTAYGDPSQAELVAANERFTHEAQALGINTRDGNRRYGFAYDTADMANGVNDAERQKAREAELQAVRQELAQARAEMVRTHPAAAGWNLDNFTAADYMRVGQLRGYNHRLARQLASAPTVAEQNRITNEMNTCHSEVLNIMGNTYGGLSDIQSRQLLGELADIAELDSRRQQLNIMLGAEALDTTIRSHTTQLPQSRGGGVHTSAEASDFRDYAEMAIQANMRLVGLTAMRGSLTSGITRNAMYNRQTQLMEQRAEAKKGEQHYGFGMGPTSPAMTNALHSLQTHTAELLAITGNSHEDNLTREILQGHIINAKETLGLRDDPKDPNNPFKVNQQDLRILMAARSTNPAVQQKGQRLFDYHQKKVKDEIQAIDRKVANAEDLIGTYNEGRQGLVEYQQGADYFGYRVLDADGDPEADAEHTTRRRQYEAAQIQERNAAIRRQQELVQEQIDNAARRLTLETELSNLPPHP